MSKSQRSNHPRRRHQPRIRRSARSVVALTTALALTACGAWKVHPVGGLPRFVDEEHPERIRVRLSDGNRFTDGEKHEIWYPRTTSDSLFGDATTRRVADGRDIELLAYSLDEILAYETRGSSAIATLLIVVAVPVVLFVTIVAAACVGKCGVSLSGD